MESHKTTIFEVFKKFKHQIGESCNNGNMETYSTYNIKKDWINLYKVE